MTFADCAKMGKVPVNELWLCDTLPLAERLIAQAYIWTSPSPLDRMAPTKFSRPTSWPRSSPSRPSRPSR